ncbi:MAG: nuclear transport factor 2 family protein [Saprospiraceae bacterium]|nr:nuclear transport factor 2 family protein [Saprospiraceae bacterium]
MKYSTLALFFVVIFLSACKNDQVLSTDHENQAIHKILDEWHLAASKADFDLYFSYMSDSSIFIGTDATENWNKQEFKAFSKPYFDRGKAWSFTAVDRNIYLSGAHELAWFDELLQTQMKICRGSGVMVKEGIHWKVKHYVLSMTIPNEHADTVVKIKTVAEDSLILKMTQNSK